MADAAGQQQALALDLMERGDLGAALAAIDAAIALRKADPLNYFIKGRLCDEALDFAGSVAAYTKCLSRDPANRKAKLYLALAHFSLGQVREGARLYGNRFDDAENPAKYPGLRPWTPKCPPGRLLIWAEQGIGDEVMFLQLLHCIAGLPVEVTVECDPRLLATLARNFPAIRFVSRTESVDPAAFDYGLAHGDLYGLFHDRLGALPEPRLTALPRADVATALDAAPQGKERIGLSWISMNADYGLRRSIPLDMLTAGLDPARHALVILQYLAQPEELERLAARGFAVVGGFDTFNDVAAVLALIAGCDRVLTIDNSAAHFAGALGVPTDLLLPRLPNWRWGIAGERTGWYPSVRLWRQGDGEGWQDVVRRIASA